MAILRTPRDDQDPFEQARPGNLLRGPQPAAPPSLGEFSADGAPSRSGESPRERAPQSPGPFGPGPTPGGRIPDAGDHPTPNMPMTPSPVAGAAPIQVNTPIPSPPPQALTSTLRGRGGMFGGQGGLTGGGFGMPFDPTSNSKSDPISTLLQKLLGGGVL